MPNISEMISAATAHTIPDWDAETGIDAQWETHTRDRDSAFRTPSGHVSRRRRDTPVQRTFRREWNRYLTSVAHQHGGWGNLTRD